MDMVAICRVVLTNREHMIALEPMDKGLIGILLRYPYEVRSESEYVDPMEALRRSVGGAAEQAKPRKSGKKPRKTTSGQRETLMPIAGKKQPKEAAAKKSPARQHRKSA